MFYQTFLFYQTFPNIKAATRVITILIVFSTHLVQEMCKVVSSPPRKRSCQSNDFEMSCQVGPNSIPPRTSCLSIPHKRRRHHVETTIFGVICFHPKCMTRLGRRFRVSDFALRTHFDKARCYTGDRPDCSNLSIDLCNDLYTLQELVGKGGAMADVMVDRVLPVNITKRSKGSYCLKCGLVGRPSALRNQHYTDQNKKCSLHHLRTGTILTSSTISRMVIPGEVVRLICKGKFHYGNHNDPNGKLLGRLQSIEELNFQASDEKMVSPSSLFQM